MMTVLDIRRELHRKSFYDFVKDYWETVEAVEFIESNLMRYLCDLFQFIIRHKLSPNSKNHWLNDREYAKVVSKIKGNKLDVRTNSKQHWNINMPPRHAKSLILNVFASVWVYALTEDEQAVKVACLSHTSKLANEMNNKKQQIINSEKFKREFPKVRTLINQSDRIIGSNLAEVYSVSMDKLTGRGLNYAILDDLVTAQTATKQQEELRNALRFMKNTLPSRMNKSDEDAIVNIAQRLGPGDVSDFIMTELDDIYQTVKLQAIAEEDISVVFPCSGEVWHIKQGESLFPERFSVEKYMNLKKQMGSANFEAQYQQNAVDTESAVIKRDMLRFMNINDAADIINNYDQIYASHDLPVSEKETADYHGAVIAYKKDGRLLFADAIERHFGFLKSQAYIKALASSENFKGLIQLLENKANGAVVIQTLQSNVPGIITVEPGARSKKQRLEAASNWLEAGNVFFLTNEVNQLSPNMEMLIDRLTKFPFVKHDDVVDAFSQLVNYVFTQKSFGLFEQSISEENYLRTEDIKQEWFKYSYTAVIREGFEYGLLQVGYEYTSDTFYVLKEETFRSDDTVAIQRIKEFAKGSRVTIDASKDNILYHMFISKLSITNNSDARSLSTQIAQLNLGFSMRKIKFARHCVEFRNDVDSIAWEENALRNGVEKLKNRERLVACLRTVIYFVKGSSEFF